MEKKEVNRDLLNGSLEVGCMRRDLIISLVIVGFYLLLWRMMHEGAAFVLLSVIFGLCLSPVFGFWIWRLCRIYAKPEEYVFCKCTLSSPHQRLWLRSMYFTVVLETEEDGRIVVDTHAIFAPYGLVGPLVEDYINETVTIGYNRETGMVVVIG